MKKLHHIIIIILPSVVFWAAGCAYPKNFTRDFYTSNEANLEKLTKDYSALYKEKPFALLFETKDFQNIGFEIITDTVKYIYHFNLLQPNFTDTLKHYQYNLQKMRLLIEDMQQIQCTWITRLDYYENFDKRFLTLMAVRNKALNSAFKGESYCTLAFFDRPQPFDEKGRLLDRADKRRNRQINGYKLSRVNDRVGYAITKNYR